jgi:hypothetical protein
MCTGVERGEVLKKNYKNALNPKIGEGHPLADFPSCENLSHPLFWIFNSRM